MSHVAHMNESYHTQRRQSIAQHKALHHIYTYEPIFFPITTSATGWRPHLYIHFCSSHPGRVEKRKKWLI